MAITKRIGVVLEPTKRQNEQSSISFPYADMDTGVSVALAILGAGGVPLSREQLAGQMNTTAGSGSFIVKTAAARIFGLIAYTQGKFELTALGFNILSSDEKKQRAAKADAFLTVPLYRRVYDEFKGKQLPPRPHGLEQAFAKFGVSSKQTRNARVAFDKSATQAGFFPNGPDRLIEPILGYAGAIDPTGPTRPTWPIERTEGPTGYTGRPSELLGPQFFGGDIAITENRLELDQLIRGLLGRLPKTGEKWEMEKRARWLQTLAANFDMVYTSDEDDKTILIECKSQTP